MVRCIVAVGVLCVATSAQAGNCNGGNPYAVFLIGVDTTVDHDLWSNPLSCVFNEAGTLTILDGAIIDELENWSGIVEIYGGDVGRGRPGGGGPILNTQHGELHLHSYGNGWLNFRGRVIGGNFDLFGERNQGDTHIYGYHLRQVSQGKDPEQSGGAGAHYWFVTGSLEDWTPVDVDIRENNVFLHSIGEPGDANVDGLVNLEDLNIVRNRFGAWGGMGDMVGNVRVGIDDLNAVRNNFGRVYTAAVPEPSALLLLLLGVQCIQCFYNRRRSRTGGRDLVDVGSTGGGV